MINGKTEIEIMDELRAMDDRKRKPLPVDSQSAGWKPSYDDLFKFWESSLNLFVEGVEFMTKEEIYQAIKADCMKASNDSGQPERGTKR